MRELSSEEFENMLVRRVDEVEEVLKEALPDRITMQKTILDAMDYSLMAGGKRIRPLLLVETYRLFGGRQEHQIYPFMAALEMIHTYSLVHDDLPAMDNDEYRRGRKTTHIVFGEDMGILAGDALLNYAYETAVKGTISLGDPVRGLKALEILSEKAGVYGMVGGQVVDVELTGKTINEDQLDFIYRLKTGALLEAAFMMGAVLAGAKDTDLQNVEKIGSLVGQAFQIQDDILDIVSTTEELGKPVGSDERNEKTTYVTIHGMDAARNAVAEYSNQALEMLSTLPGDNPFLTALITTLIYRKK